MNNELRFKNTVTLPESTMNGACPSNCFELSHKSLASNFFKTLYHISVMLTSALKTYEFSLFLLIPLPIYKPHL